MIELYPYQKTGSAFLQNTNHAYLADEMGVGKTYQAIDAARNFKNILVVCPATAKINWQREIKTLIGRDSFIAGSNIKNQNPSNIVITNYERVVIDAEKYKKVKWDVIIFDEAHYIKEPGAKRTSTLFGGKGLIHCTKRVWCLSGTPAPNHIGELWVTLFTFNRTRLDYDQFIKRYCKFFHYKGGFMGKKITGTRTSMVHEISPMLDGFMLRRKLKEVHEDMPPITYGTVTIDPQYDPLKDFPELKEKVKQELDILVNKMGVGLMRGSDDKVLAQVSMLADSISSLRRYHGLKKAAGVADIVTKELDDGAYKKIVLFAAHHDVVEVLRKKLKKFHPVALTGRSTPANKQRAIDMFQGSDKYRVFIGNILAAGTAITLTAANQVGLVEWDYVPGNNAQAISRVWRLSQALPVVCRLFSLPGFDDRLTQINERKVREINSFMS